MIMTTTERNDRLRAIHDVSFPIEDYVADAFDRFSDDATRELLAVHRRVLKIMAVQHYFQVSERVSSVTPAAAVPYVHDLWTPIVPDENGQALLADKPFWILGVKTTVSEVDDWIASAVYNPATGVISGLPLTYLDEQGDPAPMWVPEARHPNPFVTRHLLSPLGIEAKRIPAGYDPAHLPRLAELVDLCHQWGGTRPCLEALASAFLGNPFAYIPGTVTAVVTTGDFPHVEITDERDYAVKCCLPSGALRTGHTLVTVGTEVTMGQPLVTNGATLTVIGSHVDSDWSTPARIDTTAGDRLNFASDLTVPLPFMSRVRVVILEAGARYDHSFLVRRSSLTSAWVEGSLPAVGADMLAFYQMATTSSRSPSGLIINTRSAYNNRPKDGVAAARYFLSQCVSPYLSITVNDLT